MPTDRPRPRNSERSIYESPTYRGLWAAVLAGRGAGPLLDYLEEIGVDPHARGEAATALPLRCYDIARFGSGSGRGSGRGSGIGSGRGSGRGSGSGSGRGIGSGSETTGVTQMEPGKAYLIHGGDWHTFVGRVVEQVGPLTYRISHLSKITDTNAGDVWHELAAGNKARRKAASYTHYSGIVVVPLTIAAFEWVGKVPQEAGDAA